MTDYVHNSFEDARDVTVRVGDTIAWAVRLGNTGELKTGVVLNIKYRFSENSWERGWRIQAKAVGAKHVSTLQHRDRIALVEKGADNV